MADKHSFDNIDMRVEKALYLFACSNAVMDPFVYGYFNLWRSSRKPKKSQVKINREKPNEFNYNFLTSFSLKKPPFAPPPLKASQ